MSNFEPLQRPGEESDSQPADPISHPETPPDPPAPRAGRPATIVAAAVVMFLGATLSIVILLYLFVQVGRIFESEKGWGYDPAPQFVPLFIMLGVGLLSSTLYLVCAGFVLAGRPWARITIIVWAALALVVNVVSGRFSIIDTALSALIVLLLCLPPSNRFFASRRRQSRSKPEAVPKTEPV